MTQPASAQIAPISRRAIGYLIDAFIATGLVILLGGGVVLATALAGPEAMLPTLLIGGVIAVVLIIGWLVVYTLMQAGAGSIGMRAQGVRLVSAREQAPIGFGRALLRNIVFGLACSIVVGYFTPLFDGSGRFQGWHDKVAGSLMVDARAAASAAPAVPDRAEDAARQTAPVLAGNPHTGAQPARPVMPTTVPSASPATVSVPAPSAEPVAAAAPASPEAAADDGALIAFVPGISRESPPPTVAAPPHPEAESDLEVTVLGNPAALPLEDTRISIPGHRLVFTWDDGTRVSVSRRTIFGRNPAPEDGAVVVPVRDETLSLSKTHFEAAAEPSGGWVLDRHSTNGMTLVREGRRIACPAGQRMPVRLGDAIEIGDRIVTIGGYA
jgi:uncharacterized RDD family membrane protein YckC